MQTRGMQAPPAHVHHLPSNIKHNQREERQNSYTETERHVVDGLWFIYMSTLRILLEIFIASMFNNELFFYGFRVLLENNIKLIVQELLTNNFTPFLPLN